MTDIGARESLAGVAVTCLVNRTLIARKSCIHQVESSFGRESRVMARKAGRQDTIEDVDAAQHAVDQIFRRANSHQVARFVFGQIRLHHIQHGVHLLLGLAHGESADGDAGRIERSDEFSGSNSKVRLNAALDDPKESLVAASLGFEANFRPAMSPFHGELAVLMVVGVGAFVESHDDVRAEVLLNSNGSLRREAMCRAVDVTLEGHAFIVYLAGLRKREDLEAARIGEHGMRPAHEPMQATQPSHHIVAGTQVEMIGIGKHKRGAQFLDLCGREGLDRCLRANRREDGREKVAVRCSENPRAGAVVFGCDGEFEHERDYNGREWRLENLGNKICL